MVGLIVWIVGCFAVFAGVILVVSLRGDIANVLRMRREPTPIANISGPGQHKICGRAVASEQGILQAPLTGREALVYRVLIIATGGGPEPGSGIQVVDRACGQVEFVVDDGSGRTLRVDATDSDYYFESNVLFDGRRPFSGDAPPQILEWTTQRLGHPRDNVTVDERVLEPGQQVTLFGPVRVARDAQSGELPTMDSPTAGALVINTRFEGTKRSLVRTLVVAAVILVLGHGAIVVSCAVL
jgi:hypothetical protein